MWQIKRTHAWVNTLPLYSATKPNELAALLVNLKRYLALLKASKSSKAVEALYLRKEIGGVSSISQEGLHSDPADCRIYVFADDSKKVLYLLGLGGAESRDSDVEYYKNLVFYIIEGFPSD